MEITIPSTRLKHFASESPHPLRFVTFGSVTHAGSFFEPHLKHND